MRGVSTTSGGCLRPVVAAWVRFSAQTPGGDRQESSLTRLGQALGGLVDRSKAQPQEGSGNARNRARALLNWFCQGQPWG